MLAVDVAKFLEYAGIGIYDEYGNTGNIFIGSLPMDPDEAILIRSTGGSPGDTGTQLDRPTVQIIVRGTQNPKDGEAVSKAIYNALHGFNGGPLVPDGEYVVMCRGIQSAPAHIGQDKNSRHEYSLNFQFIVMNFER